MACSDTTKPLIVLESVWRKRELGNLMSRSYDYEVFGEVPKECECVICHHLMREAVEIPCGHAFCKRCIKNWEQELDTKQMPYCCSVCRKPYTEEAVHKSKLIDRMITTSLQVLCKQKANGCTWVGTISDYEDSKHLENVCLHTQARCQYQPIGCKVEFLRKDTDDHNQSHKDQHMTLLLQQLLKTTQKGVQTSEELSLTKSGLEATKNELAETKEELRKTKANLRTNKDAQVATKTELSNAKILLRETNLMANASKTGLVSTNQQVQLNQGALNVANEKIVGLEEQSNETNKRIEIRNTEMISQIQRTNAETNILENRIATQEEMIQTLNRTFNIYKDNTSDEIRMVQNRLQVLVDKFNRSEVENVNKRGEIHQTLNTVNSKTDSTRSYLHFTFWLASMTIAAVSYVLYEMFKK